MQVFKRVKIYNKKRAQNLIEFAFVLPILIFLTLCIFEVALFWQDVNSIYSLNTEINANAALVNPRSMTLGTECTAVAKSKELLVKKASMISLTNPTFDTEIETIAGVTQGYAPFALYKITTQNDVTVGGVATPQITLWIDCRNPFENGITTQLEFYHKTLVMQASIPRFDSPEPIVIIPKDIFIASPKLNTIRHY